MLIFLDLEETVIDDWENAFLLPHNIDKIKRNFVNDWNKSNVFGLMSWAVQNEDDKAKFNKQIRDRLEINLGVKFNDNFVWSMDDWARQLFLCTGKLIDKTDIFEMFGKQELLFLLSRKHLHFKDQNVLLIDDRVEHDLSWQSVENNSFVRIVDIVKL